MLQASFSADKRYFVFAVGLRVPKIVQLQPRHHLLEMYYVRLLRIAPMCSIRSIYWYALLADRRVG